MGRASQWLVPPNAWAVSVVAAIIRLLVSSRRAMRRMVLVMSETTLSKFTSSTRRRRPTVLVSALTPHSRTQLQKQIMFKSGHRTARSWFHPRLHSLQKINTEHDATR